MSKLNKAFEIFNAMNQNGSTRKDIISSISETLDVATGTATIYFYKCKNKDKDNSEEITSPTPIKKETMPISTTVNGVKIGQRVSWRRWPSGNTYYGKLVDIIDNTAIIEPENRPDVKCIHMDLNYIS